MWLCMGAPITAACERPTMVVTQKRNRERETGIKKKIIAHLWLNGFEHRSIHECNLALEEINTVVRFRIFIVGHNDYCISPHPPLQCETYITVNYDTAQFIIAMIFTDSTFKHLLDIPGEMWQEGKTKKMQSASFWLNRVEQEITIESLKSVYSLVFNQFMT